MDRLLRESNPPTGQLASPKPQYKKPGVDEYEPVEGQHGAPFAILKDASGNVVSPATEDKLEQVRQLLSGVATEAKLEQARVLLNAISNKDFATQATLAAVLAKLEQLETEIQAVKANQLSGDQKVQLSGKTVELITIINAESIPAGESLQNIDMSLTGREEEIWILVNIDKQPWSLLTNAGNTTSVSTLSAHISPIYPRRINHTTIYTSLNAPSTHLFYGLRLNMTGIEVNDPNTLEEAKKLIIPIPAGRFTLVNHSEEIATATVRILRRFKS
jgi:hypothetical protein